MTNLFHGLAFTLLGKTYPFPKALLKMPTLFQRWDILVPWRVFKPNKLGNRSDAVTTTNPSRTLGSKTFRLAIMNWPGDKGGNSQIS